MSTLEYLDPDGSVNFTLVPWTLLNQWLSKLNGNPQVPGSLRDGVNRGRVIEELEARRKKKKSSAVAFGLNIFGRDPGYERDWRDYENDHGYTHIEELLIYQPTDWRKQAREYFYRYFCDLRRSSTNEKRVTAMNIPTIQGKDSVSIMIDSPIMVVLFHPEITRSHRYEPLNFLLAYGVENPLPNLLEKLAGVLDDKGRNIVEKELSPLDYFFAFQDHVLSYKLATLLDIGKRAGFPRLCLLKEFDFSNIIGQRLAKEMIRSAVFNHIWNQSAKEEELCANRKPLSLIFAGPSGTGKTELAVWLKTLLNKPGEDDAYIKIDCGKLTHSEEVFGSAGSYQGAYEGSALNNFVFRMDQEPDARGIVLLDEIEKASEGVIHGLYQVLDKGEWTNKKLERGSKAQTETISCSNIIFILTTNAADELILNTLKRDRSKKHYVVKDPDSIDAMMMSLESSVKKKLQATSPFTAAFIGRVGRVVPFFPMATGDPAEHPLLGESITVAKLLIERQQEKFSIAGGGAGGAVHQHMSAQTKHEMARIIVEEAIVEGGVRSIQQGVEAKMSNRMMNALAREKHGIQSGAHVRYSASREDKSIDFLVEKFGSHDTSETEVDDWTNADDLFG